jgi:hypothetical protein
MGNIQADYALSPLYCNRVTLRHVINIRMCKQDREYLPETSEVHEREKADDKGFRANERT